MLLLAGSLVGQEEEDPCPKFKIGPLQGGTLLLDTSGIVTETGDVKLTIGPLDYTTGLLEKWPNPFALEVPRGGRGGGGFRPRFPRGGFLLSPPHGTACPDPNSPPSNNICEIITIPADVTIPNSTDMQACVCEISVTPDDSTVPASDWGNPRATNASGLGTVTSFRSGEGEFFRSYFNTTNHQRLDFLDVFHVDGTVSRFVRVPNAPGSFESWTIQRVTDPHDNQTHYVYSNGRLARVCFPNGIDQVWNYAPTWIGTQDPATQWDPANYSGVEVTYEDTSANPADLSGRTERFLFLRRRDGSGNLIPGLLPFAGDLLYRTFHARTPVLDDLPAGAQAMYTVPADLVGSERFLVTQITYHAGTSLVHEVSHLWVAPVGGTIAKNAAEGAAIVSHQYTYTQEPPGSGIYRVQQLVEPLLQRTTTYQFFSDPNLPERILSGSKTDSASGTVESWSLDARRRVTQRVITPANNGTGRPRASDPDNNGAVEPTSRTWNYQYSSCGACGGKPTRIEELPSGRVYEFAYDSLTGLLTEERTPSPTGTGVSVVSYQWQPVVSGEPYGAYQLTHRSDAHGTWDYSYVSVARDEPAHGKKHATVTEVSPAMAQPGGGAGSPVVEIRVFDTSPAPLVTQSGSRQTALVGQLLSQIDANGVFTEYTYDSNGYLASSERKQSGGGETIRTGFVNDRWGRPVQVTANTSSSLSQVHALTYNHAGFLVGTQATVQGQLLETKFFYDRWGNLAVRLRRNNTSSNGAPDDFGPTPRSESARIWLRDEWHYEGHQLVRSYADRRSLDRAADTGPVADAPDARYLLTNYEWHPLGMLALLAGPSGAVASFTYDGYGSLYKVEKFASGQPPLVERTFVNSSLEPVRHLVGTGAVARATLIERNAAGFPIRVTEPAVAAPGTFYPWTPAHAVREIDYDALGLPVELRLRDGQSQALLARKQTSFDALSRPYRVQVFDPASGQSPVQTFDTYWSGLDQITHQTAPGGRESLRSFDGLGRLSEVRDSQGSEPNRRLYQYVSGTALVQKVTHSTWDEHPNVAASVDRETTYSYDGVGRVKFVRHGPSGSQLEHAFTYYGGGGTESYTDPSGKVHLYLPDALGRLVEHFLPGSQAIWNETQHLDFTGAAGRTETVQTDGRGRVTRTIQDFVGRVQAILDPGATTEPTASAPHQPFARFFVYDQVSELTDLYAGDGVHVRYYRDGMGRLITRSSATPALNSQVSWFHGRDILRRDALGRVVWTGSYYGPDGQGGQYVAETQSFDGLGRPTEESFHYLAGLGFGNWVRVGSTYQGADPFRAGLTYHNGLPGNQDDLATANTFDTRGRLSAIDWQPSTSMQALASYLHDGSATRRRTTHFGTGANAHFATDYQYDTYGRMTQITQSFSSGAQVDFVYDLASNLVKEVYQKQGGSNRTGDRFTYDEHHRLHKAWLGADTTLMQDPDPETSTGSFVEKLTYGLDAAQNRTTLQRQAGSGGSIGTETYSVQEAGEPQGASNRYDQVGAVAPTYDQRGNTTFDGNFYYVYDEQNRLSEVYILSGDSAARSTSTTSLAAEAPTGSTREQTRRGRFAVPDVVVLQRARQRLLARATGGPEEILRRHAEPAFVRQLREPLGNGAARRVVAGGSESLQSRSSGTGEGGVEEDVELQLLAVYLYDVFDRRVARVVVGVQTWVVAWDGWQEAEELVPTWQNGLVMAPQRQFVWGEQLDELVGYRYRNPSTNTWASYFVAEGGAHCPQRVLDGSGQVVEVQEYDPYGGTSFFDGAGAPVGAASQVGNPFGWKAVRIDPETGLLYMRHRYYAPQWGRFLTQDPLGVWGDPAGRGNGYQYGANAPLTHSDALGLQVVSLHVADGVIWNLNRGGDFPGRNVAVPSSYPRNGTIVVTPAQAEALWRSADPAEPNQAGVPESVRNLPPWAGWVSDVFGSSPFAAELASVAMASHDVLDALSDLATGNPKRGAKELVKQAAISIAVAGLAVFATGIKMAAHGKKGVTQCLPSVARTSAQVGQAAGGATQIRKHHAWPKYLGGKAKQELVPLPRELHESFHGGLDKILPRQWGTAYYEGLAPAARSQVLQDLAAYTRAFDAKHGTQLFDALVKAGVPLP
jgi:RHS repeat-associated protein